MSEGRAPATAAEQPGAAQWWMITVLTLLSVLSAVDRQIFALMMEPIRHSLNLSSFQVGLLHGVAFALFFAVFGLAFGWATDRFDRRHVVFVGVTIWAMASTACGLAGSFIQLAVTRFGVGAGEAALGPASYSMIGDSFPRNRLAFAMGVFGMGFVVGAALSMVIGGVLATIIPADGMVLPLLGEMPQWRIIFILTGIPGFVLAFLVLSVREPSRQFRLDKPTVSADETAQFIRSRWRFFASYITGIGFLSASGFAVLGWISSHLMRKFGLTLAEVGFLLGPLQIVPGIIGLLTSGMLSDFLYTRGRHDAAPRILMVLALLQLIPAVIIALADSVWLNCFAVGMYMLCATGASSLGPSAVQLVTPSNFRGRTAATYKIWTHMVGLSLGPPLVGALVTYVFGEGPTVGLAIALVVLVLNPLAAVLFYIARRAMSTLAP
jgi:MFS family permease